MLFSLSSGSEPCRNGPGFPAAQTRFKSNLSHLERTLYPMRLIFKICEMGVIAPFVQGYSHDELRKTQVQHWAVKKKKKGSCSFLELMKDFLIH